MRYFPLGEWLIPDLQRPHLAVGHISPPEIRKPAPGHDGTGSRGAENPVRFSLDGSSLEAAFYHPAGLHRRFKGSELSVGEFFRHGRENNQRGQSSIGNLDPRWPKPNMPAFGPSVASARSLRLVAGNHGAS